MTIGKIGQTSSVFFFRAIFLTRQTPVRSVIFFLSYIAILRLVPLAYASLIELSVETLNTSLSADATATTNNTRDCISSRAIFAPSTYDSSSVPPMISLYSHVNWRRNDASVAVDR